MTGMSRSKSRVSKYTCNGIHEYIRISDHHSRKW